MKGAFRASAGSRGSRIAVLVLAAWGGGCSPSENGGTQPAVGRSPSANAGPDQSVLVGDLVALDGSSSSDTDGSISAFAWAFVSRPAGSSASLSSASTSTPSFVADAAGDFVVRLTVTDNQALTGQDNVTVTASLPPANQPPTANAGPDQNVLVNDLVALDGGASTDPDGSVIAYNWGFVSRPAGSAATLTSAATATPTFVADVEGNFVVQLTVTDDGALTGQDDVTVTAAVPAQSAWTYLGTPPYSTGVFPREVVSFALQGKGYLVGGYHVSTGAIDEVWEYDPQTDVWTQLGPYPGGGLRYLGGFAVDGAAYVGPGTEGVDFVSTWRFDPSVMPAWSPAEALPIPQSASFVGFAGDQFGFFARRGNDGAVVPDSATFRFDPSTPSASWDALPPWPLNPGISVTGFAVGDQPFIVDCCKNGGTPGATFALEAGAWVAKSVSPEQGVAVRVGQDVYMLARGDPSDPLAASGLYLYDPVADVWQEKAPAETDIGVRIRGAVNNRIVFAIDGKIYYGAGDRFGVYDPDLDP